MGKHVATYKVDMPEYAGTPHQQTKQSIQHPQVVHNPHQCRVALLSTYTSRAAFVSQNEHANLMTPAKACPCD